MRALAEPDADVPLVPDLVQTHVLAQRPHHELRVAAKPFDRVVGTRMRAVVVVRVAVVENQQRIDAERRRAPQVRIAARLHDELTALAFDRRPGQLVADRSDARAADECQVRLEVALALREVRARADDERTAREQVDLAHAHCERRRRLALRVERVACEDPQFARRALHQIRIRELPARLARQDDRLRPRRAVVVREGDRQLLAMQRRGLRERGTGPVAPSHLLRAGRLDAIPDQRQPSARQPPQPARSAPPLARVAP